MSRPLVGRARGVLGQRSVLGAGVVAIVAFFGAPASEAAVDLRWEGPAACPDAALAEARLRESLARSEGEAPGPVTAHVVVREVEGELEATLELGTAWGESRRTLRAARCEDIADAVALVVATTIDPLLGIREPHDAGAVVEPARARPEPEPEPELPPLPPVEAAPPSTELSPRASPATDGEPATEPATADREPRRAPVIVLGAVGAGVGAGLRLRAGAVLDADLGVGWRWLRVLAIGSYTFADSRPVAGTASGTITMRAWSAGALGCGVPAFGRFELPVCAGIEGGTMLGTGRGLPDGASASRPWVGVALRAGLHLRLTPRVALALDVHGIGVVLRPTFHVATTDGLEPVYTAAPVAGRAILGVQVRWP